MHCLTMNFENMISEFNKKDKRLTREEYVTKNVNREIASIKNTSKISDGSHTFGELYHHRAVLFATICNLNPNISWKSYHHSNGDMIKNFFIVGIDTPEGQFSYHYPLDYWKMFKVEIMDLAPEWDGHRSDDVGRLLSIINKEDSL